MNNKDKKIHSKTFNAFDEFFSNYAKAMSLYGNAMFPEISFKNTKKEEDKKDVKEKDSWYTSFFKSMNSYGNNFYPLNSLSNPIKNCDKKVDSEKETVQFRANHLYLKIACSLCLVAGASILSYSLIM